MGVRLTPKSATISFGQSLVAEMGRQWRTHPAAQDRPMTITVVDPDAECPSDCGPWDPYRDFSGCGDERYDEFFWLDGSLTDYTGWGSATGFYMGAETFLSAATSGADTHTIVVHDDGQRRLRVG